MNNAPDIEIYVKELSNDQAYEWLNSVFDGVTAEKKKKGMPKKAFPFRINWQGTDFFAMVFENAVADFTSVWLDCRSLPWQDDTACAIAAAAFFDKNVRVTAGGWEQESNPDAWLEITAEGKTAELVWKTS